MKKILVVDDEFLVRLGLKTIIEWEAYGYKIVGDVTNGKEALEIFDKIDPDILLTDIKMPVMDGFKLIEEVRKKKKNIQIVILSHYDDFSFAQKAVEFGADHYILKSEMNEKNLVYLLKSLSNKGRESGGNDIDLKIGRENYLKDQLFGKPADDDFVPFTLTSPPTNLFENINHFIIRGFCETSMLPENSGDMLSKTVRTIVEKLFSKPAFVSYFYKQQLYFSSIIPLKEGTTQKPINEIVDYMKQLIRNIKQYFDVAVQIGISGFGKPAHFTYMIGEAEAARKNCFFTSNSICIYSSEVQPKTEDVLISHTGLSAYIDQDDREGLTKYISEIFGELRRIKNYSVLINAIIDLLSMGKSICEAQKIDKLPSLSPAKFSYENFRVMPFINDVEKYIKTLYEAIANAKTSNSANFSLPIRSTISYIKRNYANNITLTDVARESEVSSSYLSLIFKQEMGVNFSNYLSEYRIEIAKKLLISTNKKIYEIADEVGFSSPYYFSKVFKEYTGLTCKEYKEKYAKAM